MGYYFNACLVNAQLENQFCEPQRFRLRVDTTLSTIAGITFHLNLHQKVGGFLEFESAFCLVSSNIFTSNCKVGCGFQP
jgi:hypothetical protein